MDEIVACLEEVLALAESSPVVVDVNTWALPVTELVQVYWGGRDHLRKALGDFRRCAQLLCGLAQTPPVDQEA